MSKALETHECNAYYQGDRHCEVVYSGARDAHTGETHSLNPDAAKHYIAADYWHEGALVTRIEPAGRERPAERDPEKKKEPQMTQPSTSHASQEPEATTQADEVDRLAQEEFASYEPTDLRVFVECGWWSCHVTVSLTGDMAASLKRRGWQQGLSGNHRQLVWYCPQHASLGQS